MNGERKLIQVTLFKQKTALRPHTLYSQAKNTYQLVINKYCQIKENLQKASTYQDLQTHANQFWHSRKDLCFHIYAL